MILTCFNLTGSGWFSFGQICVCLIILTGFGHFDFPLWEGNVKFQCRLGTNRSKVPTALIKLAYLVIPIQDVVII